MVAAAYSWRRKRDFDGAFPRGPILASLLNHRTVSNGTESIPSVSTRFASADSASSSKAATSDGSWCRAGGDDAAAAAPTPMVPATAGMDAASAPSATPAGAVPGWPSSNSA